MAVYTVLDRQDLQGIAADYGLGELVSGQGVPAGSVNTHYLLETSKGRFFLTIAEVKSRAELRAEIDLLLFLRRYRFPCPRPVPDKKGTLLRDVRRKSCCVCHYVDGASPEPPDLTLAQLRSVGKTLGDLHRIGKEYRHKNRMQNRFSFVRVAEIYANLRGRLPGGLKSVIRALDEEVEYQRRCQQQVKLPEGVIHGDLFADNLVFRGDRVAAVLDFEAACRGRFLFDLATAVNALCHDGREYVPSRFRALLSGYDMRHRLSAAEWDAFPNELRFSALRFTVTRLKDFLLNPVDSARRTQKDFREYFERLQVLRREREGGMHEMLMAMAARDDGPGCGKAP